MATLLPYQNRVIDEKKELDAKISSLKEFISGDGINPSLFEHLSFRDKNDLHRQLFFMEGYSDVLALRISKFVPIPSE